eukprot:CAMPEP_0114325102 /NCGR_PEP_ID=MMETSP0059-20121206/28907_1 /TAXON_ID=36894 /ORGANISM="Pyramimonas parkeae, Strain CCMP726" /LENGTH=48 /DNA_ID= /DNA_START= /DNA_END= /DNA_ORIENTATION=
MIPCEKRTPLSEMHREDDCSGNMITRWTDQALPNRLLISGPAALKVDV